MGNFGEKDVTNMASREFDLNREPLWAIPQSVQERMQLGIDDGEYRNFLLSGLYSLMALLFLVLFGFYSIGVGEIRHAVILFSFGGITIVGFGLIWAGGWYFLAKHFATIMMASLCLYLFYTGGLSNTGPLYYFVFPSVALFLHGRFRGFIWVLALLLPTIVIWEGAFGFDVTRYSNIFVSRVVAVTLIITMLSCIPEYFRVQAERNLLLSISDLEALTYGDLRTRLANRPLLEKMLLLEFNRNQRYSSACCLMFVELDPISRLATGLTAETHATRTLNVVADILRRNLRIQDIAGRWENHRFLLVLPEITLDGAKALAGRLLEGFNGQGAVFGKPSLQLTASIGIAELDKGPAHAVLERAAAGLAAAQRLGGNSYVAP